MNRTFSEYEFEDMIESALLNVKVGSKDEAELIFIWWGTGIWVSVFAEDTLEDGEKIYTWFTDLDASHFVFPDSDSPEEDFDQALLEDKDLLLGEIENKTVLANLYDIALKKLNLNKEGSNYD